MIKQGVIVDGIKKECLIAILAACQAYTEANQVFTITSLMDGKHSDKSLHYKGMAVDIRTRDLVGITAFEIAKRIRELLTADYDVVVEKTHIHIEYDPKGAA